MPAAAGQRFDSEKASGATITHFAPGPSAPVLLHASTDWLFLPFEAFERRHSNRLPLAQFSVVFVPGEMVLTQTQAPLGCIVVSQASPLAYSKHATSMQVGVGTLGQVAF